MDGHNYNGDDWITGDKSTQISSFFVAKKVSTDLMAHTQSKKQNAAGCPWPHDYVNNPVPTPLPSKCHCPSS